MADAVIVFDNVHKSYRKVKAVDGISFDVAPSTCFGLLGRNGAGKSTIMRLTMFFFSGTVFPLDSVPRALRPFAELLPLTHAIRLTRSLVLSRPSPVLLADFAFLVVATVVAGTFAIHRLRRRIVV